MKLTKQMIVLLKFFAEGEIELKGPGYVFRGIIKNCLYTCTQDVCMLVVHVESMILHQDPPALADGKWLTVFYPAHDLRMDQNLAVCDQFSGLVFRREELDETVTLRIADHALMDPKFVRACSQTRKLQVA